ncbi:hypothetical protein [Paeniglutamicibacter psychrophenolicus]|uniref:hypothetical protein n=1 Tax=Paeniglutamicibacter psychrophenolicus TaxID=257454 RepID=UPI002781E0BE|nr:hypothetical protein [Paeniglutamicibacter psychrophenolicus]MDQ0095018.1 hypothetical protein [Paeniglutamicibacter psychrophenolicus]
MAGFDFEFVYTEVQAAFVEACMRAAKVRARALKCSWRTQRIGMNQIYCQVNGQTRRLDLLGRVLEMDLPLICQGVLSPQSPSESFRLGLGFVNLFLRGRDSLFDEPLQILRSAKQTVLYYPVYELAGAVPAVPVLQTRLFITEEMLADFALGRIKGLVLLEELHTAAEQIMKESLNRTDKESLGQASSKVSQQLERTVKSNPNRMSWPELRAMCQELGYFPGTKHFNLLTQDSNSHIDHTHTPNEVVAELNRLRNIAKHQGSPDQPWIHWHWECVSAVLEYLVRKLV